MKKVDKPIKTIKLQISTTENFICPTEKSAI